MSKKEGKQASNYELDPEGVAAVQNQLFESYQSGVVEDQLTNNRGIHKFNNMKK
ncbi:hypothetical protein [Oceanobacillus arenosus]|uniref:hypothetical protein n=1 Tax=Oceanobacillus arenosus TaxID=1229153 RepID=UPI001473ED40|nr:hypothetical protein [Oceanobacillus arenosus]